jgi:hypothetical protein
MAKIRKKNKKEGAPESTNVEEIGIKPSEPLGLYDANTGVYKNSNEAPSDVISSQPSVSDVDRRDINNRGSHVLSQVINADEQGNMYVPDKPIGSEDQSFSPYNPVNAVTEVIGEPQGRPAPETQITGGDVIPKPDPSDFAHFGSQEEYDNAMREYLLAQQQLRERYGSRGRSEPGIEQLSVQDYYPDMGTPLQVGAYQGSMIGSNPIFAAGGLEMPVGIYDARRRALSQAAAAGTAAKERFFSPEDIKTFKTYQGQINDAQLDAMNWAFEESRKSPNPNAFTDRNSPVYKEYSKRMAKISGRAAAIMEAGDWATKLLDDKNYDQRHLRGKERQVIQDLVAGNFDWKDEKKFKDAMGTIRSYQVLDNAARLAAKEIEQDQSLFNFKNQDWTNEIDNIRDLYKLVQAGNYDGFYKGIRKYVNPGRVEQIARGIMDNHSFDLGGLSEEQYMEQKLIPQILNYKGDQILSELRTAFTGNANLAYKREQDKKAEYWTTKQNEMQDQASSVTDILNTPATPNAKMQAIQDLFRGKWKVGTSKTITAPGRSVIAIPAEVPASAQKEREGTIGSFNFFGSGDYAGTFGRGTSGYSFSEMQEAARGEIKRLAQHNKDIDEWNKNNPDKKKSHKPIPDDLVAIANATSDTPVKYKAVNAEGVFVGTNQNGQQELVGVNSKGVSNIQSARSFSYGVTMEAPVLDKYGEPLMRYYDKDLNEVSKGDLKAVKAVPVTKEIKLTNIVPQQTYGKEVQGLGEHNDMWFGGTKHTGDDIIEQNIDRGQSSGGEDEGVRF